MSDHQVPAAALSTEKMLTPLRKRAVELQKRIEACGEEIAGLEKSKANGDEHWVRLAEKSIAEEQWVKADLAAELAAMEQAIKVLTIFSHPGFLCMDYCYQAPDGKRPLEPFTVDIAPNDAWVEVFSGETPVAALLKAHESLYPSTQPAAAPSGPDKEEQ